MGDQTRNFAEIESYNEMSCSLETHGNFNQLDVLKTLGVEGEVLDIGCGPILHVLGLAFPSAKK